MVGAYKIASSHTRELNPTNVSGTPKTSRAFHTDDLQLPNQAPNLHIASLQFPLWLMGIDAGFDLYPPLQASSPSDTTRWDHFLNAIKLKYTTDPNVKVRDSGDVVITQGEWPELLKEGHKFRRFSSKISGSHAGEVERYLSEVYKIARTYFPGKVHWWSEFGYEGEPEPKYGWAEVYDAARGMK